MDTLVPNMPCCRSRADDGREMSNTLVARDMNPRGPSVDTLSIGLTGTNRALPAALPYGGDAGMLQVEGGGAIAQARLLKKPTATWRAPMRQANQWRLISHLSLNPLSLVEGGRDALLEILSLYNFGNSASRSDVRRVGKAWVRKCSSRRSSVHSKKKTPVTAGTDKP